MFRNNQAVSSQSDVHTTNVLCKACGHLNLCVNNGIEIGQMHVKFPPNFRFPQNINQIS